MLKKPTLSGRGGKLDENAKRKEKKKWRPQKTTVLKKTVVEKR